jgi:hypothetical protein
MLAAFGLQPRNRLSGFELISRTPEKRCQLPVLQRFLRGCAQIGKRFYIIMAAKMMSILIWPYIAPENWDLPPMLSGVHIAASSNPYQISRKKLLKSFP